MNSNDFAIWLKGFVDINGDTAPTEDQWNKIRDRLAEVCEARAGEVLSTKRDEEKTADMGMWGGGVAVAPGFMKNNTGLRSMELRAEMNPSINISAVANAGDAALATRINTLIRNEATTAIGGAKNV
jgi:hypothetical protein